jgi:hypothetical protein
MMRNLLAVTKGFLGTGSSVLERSESNKELDGKSGTGLSSAGAHLPGRARGTGTFSKRK